MIYHILVTMSVINYSNCPSVTRTASGQVPRST